jgi:hypothetical protein
LRAPRHASRLAAALALAASLFTSAAGAETLSAVGLTLTGMSYVLSEGDRVDLIVEARQAEVSPRTRRIALSGVRARIASLRGGGRQLGGLELVCERGELDLAAREFLASGAVAGRMQDGRILRTERLRYRHAQGLVSGDAPVGVSDDTGDYRGGGFQYWIREDRLRLTGGARIVQGE